MNFLGHSILTCRGLSPHCRAECSECVKPCEAQYDGRSTTRYFMTSDITHVGNTRDVAEGRKDQRMNSSDTELSPENVGMEPNGRINFTLSAI
jgi:hypothetical protein